MRVFIILFFSLLAIPAEAQVNADSIHTPPHDTLRVDQTGFGLVSDFHGRIVKPKEMMYLMKDHPQAYDIINRARKQFINSHILFFTTLPFIAYSLLSPSVDNRHKWMFVTVGVGMVTLYIWQCKKYAKSLNEAVNVYNSAPLTSARFQINAGFTSNGIGIAIGF